ncbi:MAG: hypothetical protein KBT11_03695 [Treponema sp.]|nr:hypothetical protein [Candidatus Treponema equifaecale]
MDMILSALPYGLLIGVLSIGVYISYKIMNIPDLTVDGSFAFGAVVNGIFCLYGHPVLGLFAGLLAGAIAGMLTGVIHTQLGVSAILSGVLVQTGLISVNVMIPLIPAFEAATSKSTSFAIVQRFGGDTIFFEMARFFGLKGADATKVMSIFVLIAIIVVVIAVLLLFFSTQLGLSIRATGNNEEMVKASSINTKANKVIAFSIANGIVGFAGSLYVQYLHSYSEGIGLGMLVTALASIIIGETLFGSRRLFAGFTIVVAGSLIYRVIYAFAIRNGGANGIKLFSSVIVVAFIAFSVIRKKLKEKKEKSNS